MAPAQLDWDTTLAYRRDLWSLGFAVAEAMDTAQRGMGLDWITAQELIRRSLAEAHASSGVVACGAGTDHLPPRAGLNLGDVEEAYAEQVGFVESLGGRVILMASRALASCARPRRLRARVWPHSSSGDAAGDFALAGRYVRPGAGRLLGCARCR